MSFGVFNIDMPLQIGSRILFEECFGDALIIVNLNLNQMSKWGQMPPVGSNHETIIKLSRLLKYATETLLTNTSINI